MDRFLERDSMEYRRSDPVRKSSVGGEKSKIAVVSVILIVSMVSVSFIANSHFNTRGNQPSSQIGSVSASLYSPKPKFNFTYGYATPGLWNFIRGEGTAKMTFYSNSSFHFSTSLTNDVAVFGFPAVHLIYSLPMSLREASKDQLGSSMSFDITNMSKEVVNDIAYDLFLGQASTSEYEVEIMLVDNLNGIGYPRTATTLVSNATIPLMVDGHSRDILWNLFVGNSASGGFPSFVFVPTLTIPNHSSCSIQFSPFLSYLVDTFQVPASSSIVKLAVGSEFGGGTLLHTSQSLDYSFWMMSYFILDGTNYRVIQNTGGS